MSVALREYIFVAAFGFIFLTGGCGGGKDGGTTPNAPNVQTVTVDPGPFDSINSLFTSVTICAVGSTTNCQDVDHILVDTGSSGLRIVSSVLTVSLAQQVDTNGNPIANCGQFAASYTWGPVKVADVRMSGERAIGVPIQVLGDPAFSVVPATCSRSGPLTNTVQALGANGILGVGIAQYDCGNDCAASPLTGFYYVCSANPCTSVTMSLARQLQNPVRIFPIDNNGLIISLPFVPAAGAASASGFMIFGIGTQPNNSLPVNVQVVLTAASTGYFTTVLGATATYANSFLDTGSNGLLFSSNLALCSNGTTATGFYCPSLTQGLSATIGGSNNVVNFQVANASSLLAANPAFSAFSNLGGTNADPNSFDWGLPFFFGRNVYVGYATPAGAAPYVAF